MTKCPEKGCCRSVYARGLCGMHYRRFLRHGDTNNSHCRWTLDEEKIVVKYYPSQGSLACAIRLSGRSLASVRLRAQHLKLKRSVETSSNPNWKGRNATKRSGYSRALRMFKDGICKKCKNQIAERHHKDGNTLNNKASNVVFLCRRCHMESDGRLQNLIRRNRCHVG